MSDVHTTGIRLTRETKKDLKILETFTASFNRKSFFLDKVWSTSYNLKFYTDAVQSSRYGILIDKHWAYGTWPDTWKANNICFLKFFPIVISLSTSCSELRNKRPLFMTDNESIVHAINKQTANDTTMLGLLHSIALLCLRNNIFFRARHIPGVKNVPAHSLSHLQVAKFHTLFQGMDPAPTTQPAHLLPENWVIDWPSY